jgi:hypothetical protein
MYKYGLLLLSGACLFCVEKSALAIDVLEAARRKHETPAENVRKSQRYDYLLSTDARFRRHRIAKECQPIVSDPQLRADCIASFDTYEPVRPGYPRRQ